MNVDNLNISSYSYPSDAELILIRDNNCNSVHVQVAVASGSIHDRVTRAGIAHFVEHAVYKGNAKYTAIQHNKESGKRGIRSNAYTSFDGTVHWMHGTKENLGFMLDALLHACFVPTFNEKDIRSERDVVLAEFGHHSADITEVAFQNMMSRLAVDADNKSLFRPIIGFKDHVARTTAKDLAKWHREKYVGSNVTISVLGNFNSDSEVIEMLERLAPKGLLDKRLPKPSRLVEDKFTLPVADEVVYHPTQATSCICMGWKLPGSKGVPLSKYLAEDVVENLIFYGPLSRFYNDIREKHGLSYDMSGGIYRTEHCGYMSIGCTADCDKLKRCRELMLKCFKRITAADVKRVKDSLINDTRMSFDNIAAVARIIARFVKSGRNVAGIEDVILALDQITLDDVLEIVSVAEKEPACAYILNKEKP